MLLSTAILRVELLDAGEGLLEDLETSKRLNLITISVTTAVLGNELMERAKVGVGSDVGRVVCRGERCEREQRCAPGGGGQRWYSSRGGTEQRSQAQNGSRSSTERSRGYAMRGYR